MYDHVKDNKGLWLVGNPICPFSQRVVILLNDSGLPYRYCEVDFVLRPKWLGSLSPFNKIPILVDEGFPVFESSAIIEYIDEKMDSRYIGHDAKHRVSMRSWCIYADTIHSEVRNYFTVTNEAELHNSFNRIVSLLSKLSEHLDTKDFIKDHVTALGVTYSPLFILLNILSLCGPHQFIDSIPPLYPIQKMLLRYPAVSSVDTQQYRRALIEFITSFQSAYATFLKKK